MKRMEKSFKEFRDNLKEKAGLMPCISELSRATGRSRDYIRETLRYVKAERTPRSTRFPVDEAAKALWNRFES